jgi:hypothetical protein
MESWETDDVKADIEGRERVFRGVRGQGGYGNA